MNQKMNDQMKSCIVQGLVIIVSEISFDSYIDYVHYVSAESDCYPQLARINRAALCKDVVSCSDSCCRE